jgi:radical SAM protein with 4Fe4S-binding SPASM domain
MSPAEIDHILNLIPSVKTVKLQGLGEPLFTAEIETILPKFKERGVRLWTITNGTVLNQSKHRDQLIKYFSDVTISVDSTTEELFNKIRVGAQLNSVKSGIKQLVEDRNKNNPDLSIGINFCVSHENYHELDSLYDLAVELQLDYVSVVPVENWHTQSEEPYKKNHLYVLEAQKHTQTILNKVRRLRWRLLRQGIVVGYKGHSARLGDCFWPFSSLFINVEGEMTSCCVRMHRAHSLGNIFQLNHLDQVWNGPAYQNLRKAHIQKDKSNSMCGTCPL